MSLPTPEPLTLSRRTLRFDGAPHVMGIINATPDSFSDGGRNLHADRAVANALAMVEAGAAIIDVGGESTRPGAEAVSELEELERVAPIIEKLRRRSDVLISCDTMKASVAQAALEAGADLINDVTGFTFDPKMADVVAEADAGAILMHMRGTPRDMQRQTRYDDLVGEISAILDARVEAAVQRGVARERIIVDPGIGFAKDLDGNLTLIRRAADFAHSGRPVLLGPSRKRFIGELTGVANPEERGWGTAGAVAAGVCYGAHVLRVHDVLAAVQVIQVCAAVRDA
ncbi:MAG: dihydropteroate synthase [Myxococcales bacterium]|nr:dihydropteroate synthase [Myxococcales bacterium]